MAKMTRVEMTEKLMGLQKGVRVQREGKIYRVLSAKDQGGKLCRRDVRFLEEGKPETYETPGKYLAAGRMITLSNVQFETLYARPMDMEKFEVIG